jgi:hypothetical protein
MLSGIWQQSENNVVTGLDIRKRKSAISCLFEGRVLKKMLELEMR